MLLNFLDYFMSFWLMRKGYFHLPLHFSDSLLILKILDQNYKGY